MYHLSNEVDDDVVSILTFAEDGPAFLLMNLHIGLNVCFVGILCTI